MAGSIPVKKPLCRWYSLIPGVIVILPVTPLTVINVPTSGPFLETPGNLTGLESDFDIKVSRRVGRVLTSDEVHFVSLAL